MSGGDACGYVSTALFATSYFLRSVRALLLLQLLSALLGLVYSASLGKPPLILSNGLIVATSAYNVWRRADAS